MTPSLSTISARILKSTLALFISVVIATVFFIANEDGSRLHIPFVDDAMISMQFGRMIADGHGAVWFAGGPKVEGFTNPLSVAYMALIHIVTSTNQDAIRVTYVAQSLILFWVWLEVDKYLETRKVKQHFLSLATFLCYPLVTWTLGGLEPGLICVAFIGLMRGLITDNVRGIILYGILGLLTRMDFAIFIIAFCIRDVYHPQTRNRAFIMAATVLIVLALLTFFRFQYFGELVPNTAILKISGFPLVDRLQVGVVSSTVTLLRSLSAPILVLLVLKRKPLAYVGLSAVLILAYNTYAGGDAWEAREIDNRFVTPVTLALCIEAIIAISYKTYNKAHVFGALTASVVCTLVAILVARFPSSQPLYDISLKSVPLAFSVVILFGFLVPVRSVSYLIIVIALLSLGWQNGFRRSVIEATDGDTSEKALVELLDNLHVIDRRAVVAVAHAGVPAYVMDRPLHDVLGKCDKHIARTKAKGLVIGHNKFDTPYTLETVRPDIVFEPYAMGSRDLLTAGYKPVVIRAKKSSAEIWIRLDSPYVKID
jgi:hypothetical protein